MNLPMAAQNIEKASALALKDLLGTVDMEPIPGECAVENGQLIQKRAYYIAHSNVQTLALLMMEPKVRIRCNGGHGGHQFVPFLKFI